MKTGDQRQELYICIYGYESCIRIHPNSTEVVSSSSSVLCPKVGQERVV